MVFTRTCGSKLYARNNILKNENCKYEILNHLYFGQNFAFWGTALGHFSQCIFFKRFLLLANHGGQHFYRGPQP